VVSIDASCTKIILLSDWHRDRELSYSMAVASGATPSTAPTPSAAPTTKSKNHWLTPVICVGTLLFMGVVVAVSSYNTRMRAKGKPGLNLFALED
jgi:hypothetical protein